MTTTCLYCGLASSRVIPNTKVNFCPNCNSLTSLESAPVYKPDYHAYRFSYLRPKLYYLGLKAWRCGLSKLPSGIVLDLGCGAGHALWWARKLGWTTLGWDIPEAKPYTRGVNIFYSNLTQLPKELADLVWCWHTIEHSERPREILETAWNVLKPGGLFYLEYPESTTTLALFPNNITQEGHFPEHRGLPSNEWIILACAGLGFNQLLLEQPIEGLWMYGKLWTLVNIPLWKKDTAHRIVLQKPLK